MFISWIKQIPDLNELPEEVHSRDSFWILLSKLFRGSFMREMKDPSHWGELSKNFPFDTKETEQQQEMKY